MDSPWVLQGNKPRLSCSSRTRNGVKKACDEHVCSLCWKGTVFHSTFLMSRLLWGIKGLIFEGLPGSFHHFWLQMRIFIGAVSRDYFSCSLRRGCDEGVCCCGNWQEVQQGNLMNSLILLVSLLLMCPKLHESISAKGPCVCNKLDTALKQNSALQGGLLVLENNSLVTYFFSFS